MVPDLDNYLVLIVQDDIGRSLCELENSLHGAGAETHVAHSLIQARQHVARFDFSGAIIDYEPGADDEFWQLIEELGSVPVLLCCSEAPPPSGWDDIRFITKPARLQRIVDALASLIVEKIPRTPSPGALH